MHLTNYAINKNGENFENTDAIDTGNKRSIKWMMTWLAERGHDTDALWAAIDDVMLKTIFVAQPHIDHNYRICRRVGGRAQDLRKSHTGGWVIVSSRVRRCN